MAIILQAMCLPGHAVQTSVERSQTPLPDALPELPLAVQDVLRRSPDAGGLAQALLLFEGEP